MIFSAAVLARTQRFADLHAFDTRRHTIFFLLYYMYVNSATFKQASIEEKTKTTDHMNRYNLTTDEMYHR
jgi:hypothetical protein